MDKFLKESGIIKRRTMAQELIEKGLILLNGRETKPSARVKVGDEIKVYLPGRALLFRVMALRGKDRVVFLGELGE
ncbi:MAG: RNA-binding S4 domain-containing protein [Synergistetes bacterium]|nr:RNA-binding S4 domain-containing protein [Synergistota bacterium]